MANIDEIFTPEAQAAIIDLVRGNFSAPDANVKITSISLIDGEGNRKDITATGESEALAGG